MKEKSEKEAVDKQVDNDLRVARRMFLRKQTLAIPLVLAAFSAGKPAYAQGTCIPDVCDPDTCAPGAACNPDSPCNPACVPSACGPNLCRPSRP